MGPVQHALARSLPPAVVLAVVIVGDLLFGAKHSVSSLAVVAPLLASSLVNEWVTLAYGLAALASWGVLGAVHHQFDDASSRSAALFRAAGILVGTAIAVAAAAARVRREARLRRIERVAEVAQRAILAEVPSRLGPVRLAARYESSAQDATVGGDFYAAAGTEFGTRVLVGDVRGKGLGAVRLAAEVLGAFRERADEHADLGDLLERLHAAVHRRAAAEDFVTAVLLQVTDDGVATIANAGHPRPVLLRDGTAELLAPVRARPPLGFEPTTTPAEAIVTVQLAPRDQVLLYTDGATEARRPSDRAFRDPGDLTRDAASSRMPQGTVAAVFAGLLEWTDGHLTDDVAVLAVQYQPETATSTRLVSMRRRSSTG
jgi:serine phosphatase RsbU (regulator of sigma subunit)